MRAVVLVSALALAATPALAHNGGLDANGCHNNNQKHVYECHQGPLKGQTFKSKDEAEKKMSQAAPGTTSSGKAAPSTGAQSSAKPAQPSSPQSAARPAERSGTTQTPSTRP